MAVIFTDEVVDAIRCYCEGQLRDEVARMHVVKRDMGAQIGILVELPDGWRVGAVAVATGDDDNAGPGLVAEIRRQAALRRGAMH
jgi:hypothetical protein